ncbi:phage minor head protein [Tropicibacter alexandrii]|uniref:phage minor head protein n=1 Tax=Tropicibacter alexandrii TaxID=2267683 RepID=UPI001980A933|nr:phage minor head protein [Tropicibacter alexandrii]
MDIEAFEELLAQWHNHGIDRLRKEMRAFADEHDWNELLGVSDKKEFARRSLFLYRHFVQASYQTNHRTQLAAFEKGCYVYRSGNCPCEGHAELDGVVVPADHNFWKDALPPNDWDCDCDVSGARSISGAARLGGDPEKPISDFQPARRFQANHIPSLTDALLHVSGKDVADV